MKRFVNLGCLACFSFALAVGCGDDDDGGASGGAEKCDQAAEILQECGEEPQQAECDAEAQRQADCVIKYPEGACDLDSPENDAFLDCLLGQ